MAATIDKTKKGAAKLLDFLSKWGTVLTIFILIGFFAQKTKHDTICFRFGTVSAEIMHQVHATFPSFNKSFW